LEFFRGSVGIFSIVTRKDEKVAKRQK
jgi:hypothetical protein